MKLKVFYTEEYNINLGILNKFHPFDGLKFQKVAAQIGDIRNIQICEPAASISDTEINAFVDSLQALLLKKKGYILRALEVPKIPLVPFSWVDKKVLLPMRWAVSGTLAAARIALAGENSWNIAGGFHHASKGVSEGFCIYNDIGIAVQELRNEGSLSLEDNILIIDIDVHHGNGNAYTFMEDNTVTLFDIYNSEIYPNNEYTRERVDINVPLKTGADGSMYLSKLREALNKISGNYKMAFVVAGTDVLASDKLGGVKLNIDECATRDSLVAQKLTDLSIPFAFLGGGGYSSESALAMIAGIKKVVNI
jgi:histone deacetylase 11